MSATIWPIAFFPLLGALLAYVLGRKERDWAGIIATAASALSFLWVVKLVWALPEAHYFEDQLFQWISLADLKVDFTFRVDQLSAVMCMVVTGVGTLIHLYSTAYMHEDEGRHRFFAYLNLFMFSMLLLVLGGNLMVLFIGWEGVGLCSYLLIGFWFKNLAYAAAGRKAFVVNRIGDAGFLLGIFLLLHLVGTTDFVALQPAIMSGNVALGTDFYTLVALCLFVGACGKSAQIPLFVWLPDAMAGPTPVSALIHAATMVTAGVYMLARMGFLFVLAPAALAVVLVVAVATAFVAATTALTQYDIKKVLAYSTVSQLGFMFMAAAAGAFWVAIFHVVTHAFFKACLFLGAGSVIHGCHHEQDMRHMGGLYKKMPITCITYGVSVLAIAGIFFFSGYQSKHAILGALEHWHNPHLKEWIEYILILVKFTAFLTAFYMTRSFVMTFLGEYRGHAHPHESPWPMTVPLIVLAVLGAFGGLALSGSLGFSLEHYLAALNFGAAAEHHHESIAAALINSWTGLLGVGLAFVMYTQLKELPGMFLRLVPPLSKLLSGKYYFDELYGAIIVRPLEGLAAFLWKVVDQGMIDGMVNGTAAFVDATGELRRITQTGQLRYYALMLFGATVFFIIFYYVL
ncbi:MAG: NADH-quinone oxidoreductase subunit L [Oligoflexia bacterium]|nr:NADH-quinone oxidoreductase subunit L [Oligoflexia bacterium]